MASHVSCIPCFFFEVRHLRELRRIQSYWFVSAACHSKPAQKRSGVCFWVLGRVYYVLLTRVRPRYSSSLDPARDLGSVFFTITACVGRAGESAWFDIPQYSLSSFPLYLVERSVCWIMHSHIGRLSPKGVTNLYCAPQGKGRSTSYSGVSHPCLPRKMRQVPCFERLKEALVVMDNLHD